MGPVLVLVALAAAHSPHDDVRGLAVVGGTFVAGEDTRLVRGTDGGDTLLHLDSPGGIPGCLAVDPSAPERFVLLTLDHEAFLSTDAGATWAPLALDTPVACVQGRAGALVADAAGVVTVAASGVTRRITDPTPVTDLVESASGTLLAIDAEGHLRREADGAWVDEGEARYTALAAGPGELLRGSELGIEVSTDDGLGWAFVSDVPADVLGAGASTWMAATKEEGVWLSRDRGHNWEQVDLGLEVVSSGNGAPAPGEPHWFALVEAEGTLWAAAWEGLFRMRPGETWWRQLQTRSLPLTRDLTWLDDSLLTAPYGGGLARGTPGGSDWVDAAKMLGWPWLRTVLATEGGAGRWFLVGGKHLYATDDQGETIDIVKTGNELDGDAVAVAPDWPTDRRVWETGTNGPQAVVMESADGGKTWESAALVSCKEKGSALVSGPSGIYVACQEGVWRRDDAGWTAQAVPGERVESLLADEAGVLVGTKSGLYRVGGDAAPEPLYGPGPIDALARDPDGSVWMGTAIGVVHLTPDGTATPVGWPVDDVAVALSVAADGRLAAGTYSGAWVSDDRGATWALATDWDRYDDDDTAFTWLTDGWVVEESGAVKAAGQHTGGAGDSVVWRVEAMQLTVVGRGHGTISVALDDGPATEVSVATYGVATLWSGEADPGFHELTVTVVDGSVALDGGERWRFTTGNAPEPHEPPPPAEEPCGCASAPSVATGWASAAMLGLLLRNRRRPVAR